MIKRSTILFILVNIFIITAFATGENWPVGGRSAGMSNASITLSDIWSVSNNQAGLAYLKDISAGVYYEDRFDLKDLSLKAGALAIPTKSGVFGLSTTYFGYSQYYESKAGLAYGKSFGNKFSAGVQLDYLSTHIAENYGNSSTIAAEAGLMYRLNKHICIGAHIFNPTRARVAKYNDERAPTIADLGLSYTFSDKIIVVIESEKDIQYNAVFKAGVEYHPVKAIYFRTGISTNPMLNSFGFGLEYHNFSLDFASSYHQALGFTPQFSLIYHVNKGLQKEKTE
jgi:hypothetical protein